MDSLLANYASSDEEEQPSQRLPPEKPVRSESRAVEEKDEDTLPKSTTKHGGIFDSLPPPKPSLFNSLPPPKSQSFSNPNPQAEIERRREVNERDEHNVQNPKLNSSSSSLFSSLPQPKSSSSSSASKRVVQFRPPTITNPRSASFDDDDDDEDDDEGEEERKRKRSRESLSTADAASFLSSIPAPRHSATLGALSSGSGKSRRRVLETEAASSTVSTANETVTDAFVNPNVGYSNDQSNDTNYDNSSWVSESENHAYHSGNGATLNVNAPLSSNSIGSNAGVISDGRHLGEQSHQIYDHSASLGGESFACYSAYDSSSSDVNGFSTAGSEAVDYSYAHGQHVEYTDYGGSYVDHGNNAQYENNWANATALPGVSGVVENALPVHERRGRKDIPAEIIEVKQDELMKNRPREDQVKATGIAFGPAYQPASTKGKPSKLLKRKHQISALYYDMRQKETELAERRAKGFQSKAQTQGKYGW